uniref:IdtS n=1 Tax=Epichloe bromicola TaxID=79588 RepID=A0A3G1K0L1_9HYPO|nr:IdtS [Epichloe bromicola]
MSRSNWIFISLQGFFCLAGMIWKAREGYPIIDFPRPLQFIDSSDATSSHGTTSPWLWFDAVASMQSIWDNGPWFWLHLMLYIAQLVGLSLIILHETVPHGAFLRNLAALGYLSYTLGPSTAFPVFSLWTLNQFRAEKLVTAWPRRQEKAFLRTIFWCTGMSHIGVFVVAIVATLLPRDATAPFHIGNSLLGVPDCSQFPCSEVAARHARLRQINEMTGTSSGFFLTVGLFSRTLEADNKHLSLRLMVRMFLVSLIAGPAAGSADVLLLRDSIIRSKKDCGWRYGKQGFEIRDALVIT